MEYHEKNIWKDFFKGKLSREEEQELLNNSSVEKYMRRQWEHPTQDISLREGADGEKIWRHIVNRLTKNSSSKFLSFYRLSAVAASFLLLIGIGIIFYLMNGMPKQKVMYTFASGVQSIEKLSLSDGTKVTIGPGSKLTYPEEFGKEERIVELSGQAFFEVSKDARRPFTVCTSKMNVTALGTAFEVFSYAEDVSAETVLLNGKVEIALSARKESYFLSPNEKLSVAGSEVVLTKVDADRYSAWRAADKLVFTNDKLSVILSRLEKWYDQKIVCPPELADKYRFTFTVKDESLETILKLICKSTPLEYIKQKDKYLLKLK